jgi:hypothetical protein
MGPSLSMRLPALIAQIVTLAVALPAGGYLGVFLALMFGGRDFGQLPIVTVPVGLVAATVFSVWPSIRIEMRFIFVVSCLAVFIILNKLL